MVTEIALVMRVDSPIALHQTRAGTQYAASLDYIPGTALRGALAEAYLAEHGAPDDMFRALFISEQVQYGDLWPAVKDQAPILIPATARACKRGKLSEGHEESLTDTLLDSLSPHETKHHCPSAECHQSELDRVGGYLCGLHPVTTVKVNPQLRVNTAIERGTGAVARELLFTQKALSGTSKDKQTLVLFRGQVRVEETLRPELERLLQSNQHLALGAGRSRGMGELERQSEQAPISSVPLQDRWQAFNAAAQRVGGTADTRYFSLTLQSHLALRDKLLRPVLDDIGPQDFGLPDSVSLACYANTNTPVRFVSAVTVPGWNAALGLPKPDTVALARGSALLFKCNPADEPAVLARLEQIEAEGVGERRAEGFGRVLACAPFHYERRQEVKQ